MELRALLVGGPHDRQVATLRELGIEGSRYVEMGERRPSGDAETVEATAVWNGERYEAQVEGRLRRVLWLGEIERDRAAVEERLKGLVSSLEGAVVRRVETDGEEPTGLVLERPDGATLQVQAGTYDSSAAWLSVEEFG